MPHPRTWIFRTNPETYEQAWRNLSRAVIPFTWTTTKTSQRGDLVAIYGTGRIGEVGIVGVVLRESQKSEVDGRWWTEVELTRVRAPLTRASLLESKAESNHALAKVLGTTGRASEVGDVGARTTLWRKVLKDSPRAAEAVGRWRSGEVPHPPGDDLSSASFAAPGKPKGQVPELKLQEQIERRLLRSPRCRRIKKADGIELPKSKHLGRDIGYPDIVLVSLKPRQLLLIEVKLNAMPGKTLSGIDQLERYAPALQKAAPGWAIRKQLYAYKVHRDVLRQAKNAGIDVMEKSGRRYRRL